MIIEKNNESIIKGGKKNTIVCNKLWNNVSVKMNIG